MKTMGGSYHNLAALAEAKFSDARQAGIPSRLGATAHSGSAVSLDSQGGRSRLMIVSNVLPIRAKRLEEGWDFEWDEDALVAQAKEGIPEEYEVVYVGSLSVDVDVLDQERVATTLRRNFNCAPVFIDPELKQQYYKGFCKQQLWPLLHYVLPMSPHSAGRFDAELWQAYVKANKAFMGKVVEEAATDSDFVWIHDYHLLVLPSLLRKRFNKIRCGVFLHSPFPSSEIFRTFPKREELLRSMLNADLIGFHTFDYARHFLSCCSRMLGLEHETSRGSISLDYYGRTVGIKIMPTGVNPKRLLEGFSWPEFRWRRGELLDQLKGAAVLVGVDDMDVFKGIELKLAAFALLLEAHPEWRGNAVLVQITNAPRSSGKEVTELHEAVRDMVDTINKRYGTPSYQPVLYLERHVPLHERIAFYTIADVAVVTATRDGMNLVPYEYVVCRQGPDGEEDEALQLPRESMLVVSEFVGCSPSLSGAIRVNPWSIDSVADGMFNALKTPKEHRRLRHDKHWKYVSEHTVGYWAASYVSDLSRFTRAHLAMKCYGLGLGLDTFRLVALDANFTKLADENVLAAYKGSERRLLLLDYDGTLIPHSSISVAPTPEVLQVLSALTADPQNEVWIISGRGQKELDSWFNGLPQLGVAAEHGFFTKPPGSSTWHTQHPLADHSWLALALPILKQYQESTDGSYIEVKQSALVWHYRDADPDFGNWQAKELLDHLEDVLSNLPVEVISGTTIVEAKPQGVTKGGVVERILTHHPHCRRVEAAGDAGGTGDTAPSTTTPSSSTQQPPAGGAAAAVAAGLAGAMAATTTTSSSSSGQEEAAAGAGQGAAAARQQQAPAGSSSGGGSQQLSHRQQQRERPDFVLAIGDDRSDEDMFLTIEQNANTPQHPAMVYPCVVGQRPSKAPFYVNDTSEVLDLLAKLAGLTPPPRNYSF